MKITMNQNVIDTLRRLAEDVIPIQSARIAAAVVFDGEIVSFGTNHLRSHPFQAKYGKNEQSIFWHAETNAIYNALKRNKMDPLFLSFSDLYVVRIKRPSCRSKSFIYGLAAPCEGCRRCINDFKIGRTYFSTDEQTIECR